MSTISATTLEDKTTSNNTPMLNAIHGNAKAWILFNGTSTISITDDYGIDSITDIGTGNYTINFTTAFATSDYTCIGGSNYHGVVDWDGVKTTTSKGIQNYSITYTLADTDRVSAAFFGVQ